MMELIHCGAHCTRRVGRAAVVGLILIAFGCSRSANEPPTPVATAQPASPLPVEESQPSSVPGLSGLLPTGLLINDSKAFRGYTLIAPITSTTTTLLDMEARVVRTWKSNYPPALGGHSSGKRQPVACVCARWSRTSISSLGRRSASAGVHLGRRVGLGFPVWR